MGEIVSGFNGKADKAILDAIAQFQQAKSQGELWQQVHHHLADFNIGGIWYGVEMIHEDRKRLKDRKSTVMLASLDQTYIELKMNDLVVDDDYVYQQAKAQTDPILWSDMPKPEVLTAAEKRSFELDADYGMITGVTLPSRFAGGLGTSSVGLHAPNMSWAEFDRLWAEKGETIQGIARAFDICLRENHMGEVYRLSERERECLLWLAAGLRQQQIAFKLGTTVKTVEKQIESARRKLKASTVPQAIATALIFNLINP
jgi:DNA-binding CsgD family transcriptional regulator